MLTFRLLWCGAQKNHLSGLQRKLLKLTFWNVQQLMEVRRDLFPVIRRNKAKLNSTAAYDTASGERSTSARIQVGAFA